MIVRNQRDLPAIPQEDTQWALLDLMDHGECEIVNGRWVDRHGYRELMKRNVENDRRIGP